ncbi:AzlC family ABC transporter permease [Oenococcus alcoholitolerans]|uniref:AzlC family ABC transporter permease n=1 Tax=Oenococcus alcoholitolerans TaxID=931074 RepID=UPI003F6E8D3D
MNDSLTFKNAIKEALPTVFGYIGISAAFGIVGRSSGLSLFLVVIISLFDYSGSAQFVLVAMLLAHDSISTIIFSVFIINSRMILMGTAIAPYFKPESMIKNILIGTFLTDESFALGMNKINYTKGRLNFEWFNAVNIIAYIAWIFGTVIGALLGSLITDPTSLGLGFAITAMFIGLLYLQLISDRSIKLAVQILVVGLVLVLVYAGLIFISARFVVLLAVIVSCFFGVVLKHAFN